VLREPRCLGDRAHRERLLRGEGVEGALEAGGYSGEDYAGLAAEAFGAAVDYGDDCGGVGVAVLGKRGRGGGGGGE